MWCWSRKAISADVMSHGYHSEWLYIYNSMCFTPVTAQLQHHCQLDVRNRNLHPDFDCKDDIEALDVCKNPFHMTEEGNSCHWEKPPPSSSWSVTSIRPWRAEQLWVLRSSLWREVGKKKQRQSRRDVWSRRLNAFAPIDGCRDGLLLAPIMVRSMAWPRWPRVPVIPLFIQVRAE